ncbi:hypothetical protein H4Q26_003787 [Puccinia striiformis f. sp. tritici PST-130]|nr:hypothetical protein H4Q26_003787 [Puccinia striiformis f. sp. tritici PST-130]
MFPSIYRANQTDNIQPSTTAQSGTGRKTGPMNPSHLNKAVRSSDYLYVFIYCLRDPAVFPLAIIVGSVLCVAGYFAFNKAPKEGGGVESVGPRRETLKMK